MISMLDFEMFAQTMRDIVAEDALLMGTSGSILTEEGAVEEVLPMHMHG